MRLVAFAAAMILGSSLYAADPELVSLANPESQVMAGVNVEQLKLSPFGQYLLSQAASKLAPEVQAFIDKSGFDPRRDMREILLSSSGQPGSNSSVLFLVRGTFDIPRILEFAGATGAATETYKGVSIVEPGKQQAIAFPDATLAITGDSAGVRAAIDRRTAPTAISSALAVEVNRLSTTEDAWFVSMMPLSQLQPKAPEGAGSAPNPVAFLSKVKQASGGVKFGAEAVVNLQAVSETQQDASSLATLLKGLGIGILDNSNSSNAELAARILQGLNITTDGPVTRVSLNLPEQQLEQMIQADHARQTQSENAAPPVMQSAPAPARSGRLIAAAEPPQRIRVARDVQENKLLQQSVPVYPPLAKQARISGTVHLNAIIGTDGTVQNLSVVSGHPLLVPAALEAVKQWIYAPTLLNGKPVEVATEIDVNFTLSE